MRIIALSNNKGGSGKTTTTVNLAGAFAERGLRVLVVDLDPQGSATQWLGAMESPNGLVEYSEGGVRISQLVATSTAPGVDLVPTSAGLIPPGDSSRNAIGFAIVRAFARLPDYWDLVLIDTPPSLGYLSLASLAASDRVLIPVEGHALGLAGVVNIVASMERAKQRVTPHLELLGIVVSRVNATSHTREVVARLRSEFGATVLEQTVREDIRVAEAPAFRLPVTRYASDSPVAEDYRAVAAELLERLGDLSS